MTVNVAQIPGLAPPYSGHQTTETLSGSSEFRWG